jgi:hypothetical protein
MTAAIALLAMALQQVPPATVRPVDLPPAFPITDVASLGEPSVRIPTGQGGVAIWLLRTPDSAFVVVRIPDSTYYWGDDLVISLDVSGNAGPVPGHDDFQWYFRRDLDSSVVYRGRGGRWEAPRGDPDWRLGSSREGGGWTVSGESDRSGWSLGMRLDGVWLEGESGRRPRVAFRVYDDSPGGWYTWPAPPAGGQPTQVERVPDLWGSVAPMPK